MKITWLGQAGLLFEGKDIKVMVDPYLSDSVVRVNPKNYRRVPVDESFFDVKPDVMLITHDHLDHLDPDTLPRFLEKGGIKLLCPENAWRIAKTYGGDNNYIMMDEHSRWSEGRYRFVAVKAAHSDPTALGFIFFDGARSYYISGDTVYSDKVVESVLRVCPDGVDVAFVPINGVGNNMNMQDASELCRAVGAKISVPLHFGMFDTLDPSGFALDCAVIPELYKEIKI